MTKQQTDEGIGVLVEALLASYGEYPEIVKIEAAHRINRNSVLDVLDKLQRLVFAGFFGPQPIKRDSIEYYVGELVEYVLYTLQKQVKRALRSQEPGGENPETAARRIACAFMGRLPEVRRVLAADVTAAYDGDPAAFSRDEIILSYPGIYADMVYRLAHELYNLGVPFIPRMMTEYAHSSTGVDIHPGATIGHHFFIDHGTGIVIGETTVIGNYVKIYQGVTLGALSTRGGQFLSGVKRHPTIEDHVTIYSGASILGGGTVIGEGVVIGSNAFITKSVPEKTRVSVKDPELQFMQQGGRVEFVQDFVI
ncbi:MAG: serine acetyltransferase [Desulfovibrio sp.]|jgi:serine O-acetyltransferase|nr:serine acetyltransferase [Desulfovibrio sp.]